MATFNGTTGNDDDIDNPALVGTAVADTIDGLDGNDVIRGLDGDDTLIGGNGNDSLDGGDGNDTLNGDASNDILAGGLGNDILNGSNGSDILWGGAGNDNLNGGNGVDTVSYAGSSAAVTVTIVGSSATASGGDADGDALAGIESVIGSSHNDILSSDNIFSVLEGAGGADAISGNGVAAASYASSDAGVTIALDANGNATGIGGHALGDTLTGIHHLIGSAYNDTLSYVFTTDRTIDGGGGDDNLTTGSGNDVLTGGTGNDTLTGGAGNDRYYVDSIDDVVVEAAGGGIDTALTTSDYTLGDNVENLSTANINDFAPLALTGNSLANVITGGNGNDTLAGLGGADQLQGGAGRDVASYAASGAAVFVDLNAGTALGGDAEGDVLSQIEGLTGSAYNDILIGDSLVNILNGGDGDDILRGLGAADQLIGGAGIDTASYESSAFNVQVNLATGLGSINDATGDTLSGIENVTGGGGGDTLTGDGNANILDGGAGNDTLSGGDGNDTLIGGTGNDAMTGGAGDDKYYVDSADDTVIELGGGGTDKAYSTASITAFANVEQIVFTAADLVGTGNAANNTMLNISGGGGTLNGLAGDDTLIGGNGIDTLDGGADNDKLYGGGAADSLTGGSGADLLDGGAGADAMSGGLGDDLYFVDNDGDVVTELAGQGTDRVSASISYTLTDNVENLTLDGTGLVGTGNGGANTLQAAIAGSTLNGMEGNDTLLGRSGIDVLAGGGGNDVLNGGTNADAMSGGLGDDLYYVDNDGDVVTELAGQGTDRVIATISYTLTDDVENLTLDGTGLVGTGNGGANTLQAAIAGSTLNGMEGDDTLNGRSGRDKLFGGDGNDVLNGGSNADTMSGGLGDDAYYVDNDGDVVTELAGQGTDRVRATVSHTLTSDVENMSLEGAGLTGTGNSGANTLQAAIEGSTLNGMEGDDTLLGRSGTDVLSGGAGNDILSGGAGRDLFVFDSLSDGIDRITDWTAGDRISLDRDGFGLGALDPVAVVVGTSPTGLDGDVLFYQSNTGKLFWHDGDTGDLTQFALLSNKPASLDISDFQLV